MRQDAEIDLEIALEEADRRTLAAVLTHLTGRTDLITDGTDRDEIKHLALRILPEFVGRHRAVDPPSDEVLRVAMRLAADGEVPDSYGPFVREQMAIGPAESVTPVPGGDAIPIVIIGAGVTGLALGCFLDRAGLTDFTILDKNPSAGGTWWVNRYPGCRVDTPSLLYSYSFDPDPGWPHHFSYQPSLLEYMQSTAKTLGERVRTSTTVESLAWRDDEQRWDVGISNADGRPEVLQARIVVGAMGFLSQARLPRIPGMDSFRGASFHSSDWDASCDIRGKRVAVIGTGASANQIVPAIAGTAREVVVYQRSPHWVMPHPYYDKPLTGAQRWLIEQIPTYMAWFRFRQFWVVGDGIMPMMRIDPAWPGLPATVNAQNEELRSVMLEHIRSELAHRPDLIEKVTPDFPPYAKRMVIDNGWYRAVSRPDVRLVTEPIEEITAAGVRTASGVDEVDIVVYATGFYTNHVLSPISITGRNGVDVRSRLDRAPEAYLGIALQDCPNLFLTSGPNGVLVHGGAGTLMAEIQCGYIIECIRQMAESGWAELEIRESALRRFVDAAEAENAHYVWSTPTVTNWYAGSPEGGASLALPWPILDFWREAKRPRMDVFSGSPANEVRAAAKGG